MLKIVYICSMKRFRDTEYFVSEDGKVFRKWGEMYKAWELILNNSGNSVSADDKIKTKILNSILKLYCLKYTPGVKKRRRYLIYYAISILTEKYDTKVDIIKDKEIVETVVKKINAVYKQIKKNEIGPKVDYLMCDIKKSNIEKTIDKLQMVNKYDFGMRDN